MPINLEPVKALADGVMVFTVKLTCSCVTIITPRACFLLHLAKLGPVRYKTMLRVRCQGYFIYLTVQTCNVTNTDLHH